MQLKFQDKTKILITFRLEMEIIDTVLLNLLWFISPTFNPNEYKQNWDSNIE